MDRPRIITGRALLQALVDAGVLSADHPNVQRVVIDIPLESYPVLYVEMAGDERLLSVAQTLDGVQISRGPEVPRYAITHGNVTVEAVVLQDGPSEPPLTLARPCGCGTEIFFALTPAGNRMPVVLGSAGDPSGNLAVWADGPIWRCRVLKKTEQPGRGEARYRSHFADCQFAASYRATPRARETRP